VVLLEAKVSSQETPWTDDDVCFCKFSIFQ
jgi:hypothetical protein